eukprot:CAMPEP_0118905482 /NCGR_PEP_ID=MMETSP1166-20130328/9469_1 /TAXON_ID=1104430 /ORGANISM="Chrysoreinhardia sp, Strain CCMP3193" /LENGTH=555 /DNA_ID=CAMNT_0006844753 /DNA_START=21 /DNA_END=1688 /DNA_ORIENTATION=+
MTTPPATPPSGSKSHAVRFRMSQHQLAYKKHHTLRRRSKKREGFRSSAWLCGVGGVAGVLTLVALARQAGMRPASLRGEASLPPFPPVDCVAPAESRRLFYSKPSSSKFADAMTHLGWRRAAKWTDAEVLWFHQKSYIDWEALECWQTVNHLRLEGTMSNKGKFYEHLRRTNASAFAYLPETYALWDPDDRRRFQGAALSSSRGPGAEEEESLDESPPPLAVGGKKKASSTTMWVLKVPTTDGGKAVEIVHDATTLFDMGNTSSSLVPLLKATHEKKIAQRYVSNLLLLDGHKFDLRVYWCVASTKPLLLLYHDGTLRVSLTKFDAADGGKGTHLTNAAQQAGGHGPDSDERSRRPMAALWDMLERERQPHWPRRPRAYVECEIRRAVTSIWQAFQDALLEAEEGEHDRDKDDGDDAREDATTTTAQPSSGFHAADTGSTGTAGVVGRTTTTTGSGTTKTGNKKRSRAFSLLGLDIMLDQNLKLHVSEVQSGPGLPSNTQAVADVVGKMVPALANIVTSLHTSDGGVSSRRLPPLAGFEVLIHGSDLRQSHWCRA